jgi:hypothetical protein
VDIYSKLVGFKDDGDDNKYDNKEDKKNLSSGITTSKGYAL